jgi:hypothetical protein
VTRPTIHVTNASSRKLHRGRVFNIMARPRHFERFSGNVRDLTPLALDLELVRNRRISLDVYRQRFDNRCLVRFPDLAPGRLRFLDDACLVVDGDTLVCACSKAAAARGQCHRAWAAVWLQRAGWRVVLDGVALAEAALPARAGEGERPAP